METSQSVESPYYIRRKPLPSLPGDNGASQVTTYLDHFTTLAIGNHEHQGHVEVDSSDSDRDSLPPGHPRRTPLGESSTNIPRDDSPNTESVKQAIYNLQDSTPSRDSLIADKNRQRRRKSHGKTNVIRSWLWETIASIFSLLCLASIVGVLVYEDGKQLDQWGWSLPPTAVVSFIGTLGKASLALVLSQILSQWKWLHFTEARPLRHMRIFDQASRGPLGSALVMWKSKGFLASVAACMMVLTILVDPFVQLVFTFPSIMVVDDTQQAVFQSINTFHEETQLIEDAASFEPAQQMWVGMYQGILPSTNSGPSVICPSGDCVWPDVQTLGVCASCSNVTASVEVTCSNTSIVYLPDLSASKHTCNYSFPDFNIMAQAHRWLFHESDYTNDDNGEPFYNRLGRTLWNSTALGLHYPDGDLFKLKSSPFSQHFKWNETKLEFDGKEITAEGIENYTGNFNIPNTTIRAGDGILYKFSAIRLPEVYHYEGESPSNYSTNLSFPPATCWNCEFFWCEKTISNMRVSGGSTSPSVSTASERILFAELALTTKFQTDGSETWPDNAAYGVPMSELDVLKSDLWTFKYRVPTYEQDFFANFFSSFYIDFNASFEGTPSQDYLFGSSPIQIDLYSNPGLLQAIHSEENMDLLVSRLADGITENIRTRTDSKKVLGQVRVSRSFIHVRWAWLALPLALMAITCILLPIVAIKSHRAQVDVWKDDPLALLFHGVDNIDLSGKICRRDLDSLLDDMHVGLDRDTPLTFTRRYHDQT